MTPDFSISCGGGGDTSRADVQELLSAETLRRPGGNRVRAAGRLGISPRTIDQKHASVDPEME